MLLKIRNYFFQYEKKKSIYSPVKSKVDFHQLRINFIDELTSLFQCFYTRISNDEIILNQFFLKYCSTFKVMIKKQNSLEIVPEEKSGITAVEQQTEVSHKKGTIWEAVLKADQETLDRLLQDNPKIINARGPVGECPIHMLFLYGSETHLNMAQYLIKRFPQIIIQIYNKPVSIHIYPFIT